MDPIVKCALQLMKWALAMLDKSGPTIAACRLQHAIDTVEAGSSLPLRAKDHAMSRSRRRSPFIAHTTAETDKPWKQQSARQLRRIVHQLLGETSDGDALPPRRAVTDAWGMKDGKQRIETDAAARWWRK